MNAEPNPLPTTSTPDQVWAAMMLCRGPDACTSVLAGHAVRAGLLDGIYLRRATRRLGLPHPHDLITVTPQMLDAIVEAGPIGTPNALVEVDGQLW